MRDKAREFRDAPLSPLQQILYVLNNRVTRLFKRRNRQAPEFPKSCAPAPDLWVLESSTVLPEGVTLESWFIRNGTSVIRSEVYKLEDGSVVAFQDNTNGENGPLRMDAMFKALYEDEGQFGVILHYSGVIDPTLIELYHLT